MGRTILYYTEKVSLTLVYAGHPDPDIDVLLNVFAEEVFERYKREILKKESCQFNSCFLIVRWIPITLNFILIKIIQKILLFFRIGVYYLPYE